MSQVVADLLAPHLGPPVESSLALGLNPLKSGSFSHCLVYELGCVSIYGM